MAASRDLVERGVTLAAVQRVVPLFVDRTLREEKYQPKQGEIGPAGPAGADGVSIVGGRIDDDGVLWIQFGNQTEANLGRVVGRDGRAGEKGEIGAQGVSGRDGRSVSTIRISDEHHLQFIFSDGQEVTLEPSLRGPKGEAGAKGLRGERGAVGPQGAVGEQGPAGADGKPGKNGERGHTGAPGLDGKNGKPGEDGVGVDDVTFIGRTIQFVLEDGRTIHFDDVRPLPLQPSELSPQELALIKAKGFSKAYLDEEDRLVVVYEDGQAEVVSRPLRGSRGTRGQRGKTGMRGATGESGRGIKDATVDVNGRLLVEYTDSRAEDLGQVRGKDGAPGDKAIDVRINDQGELVIAWSKSGKVVSENYGRVKGDRGKKGDQGERGHGIKKLELTDNSKLRVVFGDGRHQILRGSLQGPQGEEGAQGEPGIMGPRGYDGAPAFGLLWEGTWMPGKVYWGQLDDDNPNPGQASVVRYNDVDKLGIPSGSYVANRMTSDRPSPTSQAWSVMSLDGG